MRSTSATAQRSSIGSEIASAVPIALSATCVRSTLACFGEEAELRRYVGSPPVCEPAIASRSVSIFSSTCPAETAAKPQTNCAVTRMKLSAARDRVQPEIEHCPAISR